MPRLVLGTLQLSHLDEAAGERLLDAAFEHGVAAFDTAPVYGQGAAERRLGSWLRKVERERVTIIGKGCHPHGTKARMDPVALDHDVSVSLGHLGIDCLDLYLLHRDDSSRPVADIVVALNEQVERGRIRAFGASNWTLARITEAHEFANRHGLRSFSVSSPGFSLARAHHTWPGCVALGLPDDAAELEGYRAMGIELLLWSPLAGGFLCKEQQPGEALDWQAERALEHYDGADNRERRARLQLLGRELGVGAVPLALAYAFSVGPNVGLVLGCRTAEELAECTQSTELDLEAAQLRWLEGTAPAPEANPLTS